MFVSAGAVVGDPFWDGIRDAIVGKPSNETQECHQPKPILFSTGEVQATWTCLTSAGTTAEQEMIKN